MVVRLDLEVILDEDCRSSILNRASRKAQELLGKASR
jgi:hypothetical protein